MSLGASNSSPKCVSVLRLSSRSACCQKTINSNECWLASFNSAKGIGSVTVSPPHLQSQPHSYSYCSPSFQKPFILFIPFLHSCNREVSHRGILRYLNPLQHQLPILPTTSYHINILPFLQHPHTTSQPIILSYPYSYTLHLLLHTSTLQTL